jgi:endonuclease/exonuclease/phosphatase family metal-dependent hydrolase
VAYWGLAAPLLLAVSLGLVAQYVDPRGLWWLQLFAVVLPFLGFGLAAAVVLALVLRRRGLALAKAALLLFVLVRAEPWARLGGPASGDEGAFHLVSFNVPERLPPAAMQDSMSAFIARERPDVLAMQDAWVRGPRQRREAWQAPQVRGVVSSETYDLVVPSLLPGVGGWKRDATGVPLLVREGGLRVLEQEAIVISDPRDNMASQAIRTQMEWGGRSFVLYNVHLRSFGDAKPWQDPDFDLLRPRTWGPSLERLGRVYRQRAVDVDRIVAAVEREELPVVISGDFNSTADNWSYRRLRQAGGVRRLDAYREAGSELWGRTFHAETLVVRIDHVLLDPSFDVLSADVRDVGFSDHRPVLVRLRWGDGS